MDGKDCNIKNLYTKAREYLKMLSIEDLDPSIKVGQLNAAMQQIVMIVRALATKTKIFELDELISALTLLEVEIILCDEKLKDAGCSIIFVSHRLEEVLRIADRIVIL